MNGTAQWEKSGEEFLAVKLNTGVESDGCLAAFTFQRHSGESLTNEKLRRLRLVADIPAVYQLDRIAIQARTRVEHFAGVLDLMVLINAEKRFLSAAMTFCNELASRHKCDRVSIGWLDKNYVRIQAMSHVDRFDKKTEAVQKLETAMEEAFDQNTEIAVPAMLGSSAVDRDHRRRAHGAHRLACQAGGCALQDGQSRAAVCRTGDQ